MINFEMELLFTSTFRRPLYKGDILEVQILSVVNPGSFHVKILGPDHILDTQNRGLSRLTEKMTAFYEAFKMEDVVQINEVAFLEGKIIDCRGLVRTGAMGA